MQIFLTDNLMISIIQNPNIYQQVVNCKLKLKVDKRLYH